MIVVVRTILVMMDWVHRLRAYVAVDCRVPGVSPDVVVRCIVRISLVIRLAKRTLCCICRSASIHLLSVPMVVVVLRLVLQPGRSRLFCIVGSCSVLRFPVALAQLAGS